MPEILLATTNSHKLEEVRAIFQSFGLRVVGLRDVPGGDTVPEPVEDGETFEANALVKAAHYAQALERVCLADDSGLEVDALRGEPGVHSAYYAHGLERGPRIPRAERDAANNAKLLDALLDVPDDERTAQFVCVMVAASPDGSILAKSWGAFEGRIARAPRGANGFGYDPLLVTSDGRTSAELSPDEKNARSHRGAAARAIAPALFRILTG